MTAIEKVTKQAGDLIKNARSALEYIASMPTSVNEHVGEIGIMASSLEATIFIGVPDYESRISTRKLLVSLKPMFDHHVDDSGAHCFDYTVVGTPNVRVIMSVRGNGESCRIEKVGEKTVPVYRVKCGGSNA